MPDRVDASLITRVRAVAQSLSGADADYDPLIAPCWESGEPPETYPTRI
jgi:hypothetical protein